MDARLTELADRQWDTFCRAFPTNAALYGDFQYFDLIERRSPVHIASFLADFDDIHRRASAIDPAELDSADRITRSMLLFASHYWSVEVAPMRLRMLVDPLRGYHATFVTYGTAVSVNDAAMAQAYLDRLRDFPNLVADLSEHHLAGVSEGHVASESNVQRVLDQLDAYLAIDVSDDPIVNRSAPDWPGQNAWREELTTIMRDSIRPALADYRTLIANDIAPRARPDERPGLLDVPGGPELYEEEIRRNTTLELTADEVHQIGLDTMAELHEEFSRYGSSVFGTGAVTTVLERMADDDTLAYQSAEDIVAANEAYIDKAMAEAPTWFNLMPEAPCRMEEIPAALAPGQPPAYYFPPSSDGSRPGTYFINTHDPAARKTWEMAAIAYHEAVPGHHFQVTVAGELEHLPNFQRYSLVVPYGEGWGLYTERLADEMGLYDSDLDRLGMVSADAWRAGRLVVDTGMHHLGWSRARAIEYLSENTPIDSGTIAQEVDRYVGMPGQALAYMIGKRQIMHARERAQAALGDAFDIKGFHDVVLGNGAMPLPMLSALVDEWVGSLRSP